jgi:hypothetical protein
LRGVSWSRPWRYRFARAYGWRKLLETGVYGTIEEITAAERINSSHVGRLVRLSLLAPAIVEAIVHGRQSAEITLAALMRPFPINWDEQRAHALVAEVVNLGVNHPPTALHSALAKPSVRTASPA